MGEQGVDCRAVARRGGRGDVGVLWPRPVGVGRPPAAAAPAPAVGARGAAAAAVVPGTAPGPESEPLPVGQAVAPRAVVGEPRCRRSRRITPGAPPDTGGAGTRGVGPGWPDIRSNCAAPALAVAWRRCPRPRSRGRRTEAGQLPPVPPARSKNRDWPPPPPPAAMASTQGAAGVAVVHRLGTVAGVQVVTPLPRTTRQAAEAPPPPPEPDRLPPGPRCRRPSSRPAGRRPVEPGPAGLAGDGHHGVPGGDGVGGGDGLPHASQWAPRWPRRPRPSPRSG